VGLSCSPPIRREAGPPDGARPERCRILTVSRHRPNIRASGELVLGTWQSVFLAEWDGPRAREIALVVVSGS
jgi:hypothetical protein